MPVTAVRTRALVLAVVFLVGSFGLSALDALAFHRVGMDQGTLQPHFEVAGTTCGHGDRCILGATFPGPRIAAPLHPGESSVQLISFEVFALPSTSLSLLDQTTPCQPRAPPVSVA